MPSLAPSAIPSEADPDSGFTLESSRIPTNEGVNADITREPTLPL